MSNQAEPKNNTSGFKLTTQSLGIADTNVKDFAGFMLSQEDISTAAMKILLSVGIKNDAIRCIKVGCDESKKLKILAEISKDSLVKKNTDSKWYMLDDTEDEDDNTIFSKEFFNTLKNKVYYKHLNYKTVNRRTNIVNKNGKKIKIQKKYIQIEFDPEIFIAFVYNLDFTDVYYKISCRPIEWMNDNQISKKFDKRSDSRRYLAEKTEYLENRLRRCTVVVTFSIDKSREKIMYDKIIDKIYNNIKKDNSVIISKEKISEMYPIKEFYLDLNSALSSGDFNPKQVSQWRD